MARLFPVRKNRAAVASSPSSVALGNKCSGVGSGNHSPLAERQADAPADDRHGVLGCVVAGDALVR
ncbi:MAG: hypothetical protein M0008_05735 [Actinomycetota bacterium]|nr:hypothetical protein [Actinomycetota bacterium]